MDALTVYSCVGSSGITNGSPASLLALASIIGQKTTARAECWQIHIRSRGSAAGQKDYAGTLPVADAPEGFLAAAWQVFAQALLELVVGHGRSPATSRSVYHQAHRGST